MDDRCKLCGQPAKWEEDLKRMIFMCSCLEQDPNYCSDGACEGMECTCSFTPEDSGEYRI